MAGQRNQPADAEVLFRAAGNYGSHTYGAHEELARITLHFRSGRQITLDAPAPVPSSRRPSDPAPARASMPPIRRGPGFRSVHWLGTLYSFSKTQGKVFRLLWHAWEAGTPDVPDELLIRACGTEQPRLVDVFRDCAAWGVVIVEGATRGTHRIAEPPEDPA